MAGKTITGDPGKSSTPLYDYLRTLTSPNTRRSYGRGISSFLLVHIPEADDDEARARRYLENGRDPFGDVVTWINASASLAPTSLQARKAAVIGFLDYHEKSIPDKRKKIIARMVRGGPRTQDISPSRDQLRKILHHGNAMIRIAVLIMSSSGIRIGELAALRWTDIKGDLATDRPLMIRIRAETTKTKIARTVWISSEAADALTLWRDRHPAICDAVRKHNRQKGFIVDEGRIIPIDLKGIKKAFQRSVQKAGLDDRDPSTGWHLLHPHTLRKYLRNELVKAEAVDARDYVDKIIGHESQLDRAYGRLSPDAIHEFYRTWEHLLWIERPVQIASKELKSVQAENVEMQARMQSMEKQMRHQESVLEKLQIALAAMEPKPKGKK